MKRIQSVLMLGLALLVSACGGETVATASLPEVRQYREGLAEYPEYAIQLLALKEVEKGGEKQYQHQFKLVWTDPAASAEGRVGYRVTPWSEISRAQYRREKSEAGQVIFAKRADGSVDSTGVDPEVLYGTTGPGSAYAGQDDGISGGEVAAAILMAEVLDEMGDMAEYERKRKSRAGTSYPSTGGHATPRAPAPTASAPAAPPRTFDERARARMNQPGVGVAPPAGGASGATRATPATPAATPAPASFRDRVTGRMTAPGAQGVARPGAAGTPPTSFQERARARMEQPRAAQPATPATPPTPSFQERARARMNQPAAPSAPRVEPKKEKAKVFGGSGSTGGSKPKRSGSSGSRRRRG